ncbi:MAG: transporter [Burkholderiales bacterium]|jgi:hypothetical protein|nr:transporter [Burkholderiales bacterium]
MDPRTNLTSHFRPVWAYSVLAAASLAAAPVGAQPSSEELAKKLSNPVAALISVPIQVNYDDEIGKAELGKKWTINLQPVIPIEINTHWNVISRTIVPLVSQTDIFAGSGRQSGLGDVVQSLFFSPKAPTAGGWIWGAGPVFLLPTGTDDLLSGGKWGAGPTAVVLRQKDGWTFGALGNHIWSFAGDSARSPISATFVQPFVSFTTKTATTYGLNTESTYDWKSSRWTVPLNASVSQVLRVGDQLISVAGGLRYGGQAPDSAPSGWGARVVVTLLFPK